jgi:hypothetical protein
MTKTIISVIPAKIPSPGWERARVRVMQKVGFFVKEITSSLRSSQ